MQLIESLIKWTRCCLSDHVRRPVSSSDNEQRISTESAGRGAQRGRVQQAAGVSALVSTRRQERRVGRLFTAEEHRTVAISAARCANLSDWLWSDRRRHRYVPYKHPPGRYDNYALHAVLPNDPSLLMGELSSLYGGYDLLFGVSFPLYLYRRLSKKRARKRTNVHSILMFLISLALAF